MNLTPGDLVKVTISFSFRFLHWFEAGPSFATVQGPAACKGETCLGEAELVEGVKLELCGINIKRILQEIVGRIVRWPFCGFNETNKKTRQDKANQRINKGSGT